MYTASVVLMGQSVVHISQQLRNCQKKLLLLQDADRRCWCMPLGALSSIDTDLSNYSCTLSGSSFQMWTTDWMKVLPVE